MLETVRAFVIGGYLLMIAAAVGYAKLLIKTPREHKARFALTWLALTALLTIAFRLWAEPALRQNFARAAVDGQLDRRPGLREMAGRHPDVRAALEQVALLKLAGADTADEALIAAASEYATAVSRYDAAYLAIAADAKLLSYAGALASTISQLNERSGFVCGALLNWEFGPIAGAIDAGVDTSDLMNARDAALLSAFVDPHALLPAARAEAIDARLTQFLERRYGSLRAKVLLNALSAPTPADDPELCTAIVVMLEYALALPKPDREDAIRVLFQAYALESRDVEQGTAGTTPQTL